MEKGQSHQGEQRVKKAAGKKGGGKKSLNHPPLDRAIKAEETERKQWT